MDGWIDIYAFYSFRYFAFSFVSSSSFSSRGWDWI